MRMVLQKRHRLMSNSAPYINNKSVFFQSVPIETYLDVWIKRGMIYGREGNTFQNGIRRGCLFGTHTPISEADSTLETLFGVKPFKHRQVSPEHDIQSGLVSFLGQSEFRIEERIPEISLSLQSLIGAGRMVSKRDARDSFVNTSALILR